MAVFDFLKSNNKGANPAPQEQPEVRQQPAQEADARTMLSLPVDAIRPNPYQPRKSFDEEGLEELAESIAQVGLIQPVVVRLVEGGYELVAGERRLRACKLLGMQEIPSILEDDMAERQSAVVALIENLQRENLHYLEEAESYAQLLQMYGLTQEELAAQVGKSQSAIANKLRVLRLSPEVKGAMTEARMTERHARALLKLKDEATQMQVIGQVRNQSLSVKETERLVEKTLQKQECGQQKAPARNQKVVRFLRDFRLFMNTIQAATKQLEDAGMDVTVEQEEHADGIDVHIRVRRE